MNDTLDLTMIALRPSDKTTIGTEDNLQLVEKQTF
jgi:hypothetical protein